MVEFSAVTKDFKKVFHIPHLFFFVVFFAAASEANEQHRVGRSQTTSVINDCPIGRLHLRPGDGGGRA